MIKVFILVVISKVNSGEVVNFQEFCSLKSCQANATVLSKRRVTTAYCTEK